MISPQLRDKLVTAQRVTTPVENRKESPLQRERVGSRRWDRPVPTRTMGKKPFACDSRVSYIPYRKCQVIQPRFHFRGLSWLRQVRRCGTDMPTPYYATSDSWSIHWLLIAFKCITLDISPRSEHGDPSRELVGS